MLSPERSEVEEMKVEDGSDSKTEVSTSSKQGKKKRRKKGSANN
jgi:hypothetical protein